MASTVTIRDLEDGERAWANALYQAIRFEVTPPDAVALVAEVDGERVGLGRLVAHAPDVAEVDGERVGLGRLVAHASDVVELGGIWTDEAVRGRGLARAMVNALLTRYERTRHAEIDRLWCIPFAHLSAFYQSFGFNVSAPPWPPAIAAKVAHCVEDALPDVVVLVR
jgi:GNAT superfamily N-acetyltransferase